ncbi:phosphoribosylglycinamide formyltransferase [Anoxynatronum sibiricum]|uniref:Phosphoribosylglycinamide formyltransferase n=1 Tax=Anoxynatronum sibiricum TaxID=210623 RepID=A0ABU9VWX5_9CLOT
MDHRQSDSRRKAGDLMQFLNISVLISGGGTNLEALLQAIEAQNIPARVVQVIASHPDAYGLVRAQNRGISTKILPVNEPEKADKLLLEWLEAAGTQLVVLAGYLKKVPLAVVAAYSNRMMNIHPSLIPAFAGPGWYGMKVHEGVWQRGVKLTGATVHFVNGEMDGGPIILQEAVALSHEDDPAAIQQKVLAVEHRLLPRAVSLFAAQKLQVAGHRVILKDEVSQQ